MSSHPVLQPTLLGNEGTSFDPSFAGMQRRELGYESWIDQAQGFLAGHRTVFDALRDDTRWHGHRRLMYDRMVDVPRLTASIPRDGPGHPVIREVADALGERYGATFDLVALALYRDGQDSVAWHRDKARRERRGRRWWQRSRWGSRGASSYGRTGAGRRSHSRRGGATCW